MFDPQELEQVPTGTALSALPTDQLATVQRGLAWLAYPISLVDGLYGPNTRSAFSEFQNAIDDPDPSVVSDTSIDKLIAGARETGRIIAQGVDTEDKTKVVIAELCRHMGLTLDAQVAYVWATTLWETAHTFKPVREGLDNSDEWRRQHLATYYPYYGRGYVQLTWQRNYDKYGRILKIDLVENPDLALNADVSLFVLVHGFETGAFTGRSLAQYVNEGQTDFKNARRCINGLDRWPEIKEIAEGYLAEM